MVFCVASTTSQSHCSKLVETAKANGIYIFFLSILLNSSAPQITRSEMSAFHQTMSSQPVDKEFLQVTPKYSSEISKYITHHT